MAKRTFCNPVNINYQYQHYFRGRESADPAVVIICLPRMAADTGIPATL